MLKEVAEEGEAFSKSLSETIPTNSPCLITGVRRIFSLRINSKASEMGVLGGMVTTG